MDEAVGEEKEKGKEKQEESDEHEQEPAGRGRLHMFQDPLRNAILFIYSSTSGLGDMLRRPSSSYPCVPQGLQAFSQTFVLLRSLALECLRVPWGMVAWIAQRIGPFLFLFRLP